jgi:hypothetical protein
VILASDEMLVVVGAGIEAEAENKVGVGKESGREEAAAAI